MHKIGSFEDEQISGEKDTSVVKEKSQLGCIGWESCEQLTPQCYDFAYGALADCHQTNETAKSNPKIKYSPFTIFCVSKTKRASDFQNSCVYPPYLGVIMWGRHKNFEDPMLLGQE